MAAAIAGGVTSLACPPDTDPPLDEPGLVEMLKHRARSLNQAHVYPIGALTVAARRARRSTEMGELHRGRMRRVLAGRRAAGRHASSCGARCNTRRRSAIALWLRPHDPHLGRGGVAHDGEVATRLGLPAFPRCAETIALATILRAGARNRRARAPVPAVVRGKRRAGARGEERRPAGHLRRGDPSPAPVATSTSAGSTPMRGSCRRCARRATARRCAPASSTAPSTSICSDHAPVDDDAKQVPFGEAEPGATGLELLLPLTLKWAARGRRAAAGRRWPDHERAANSSAPTPGDLGTVARIADVCVFDPLAFWKVERSALSSQGKNTPFLGLEVPGKVRYTLVGGTGRARGVRVRPAPPGAVIVARYAPASVRHFLQEDHLNETVDLHLKSLLAERNVDRRAFVVTSLGAGFAMAVHAGLRADHHHVGRRTDRRRGQGADQGRRDAGVSRDARRPAGNFPVILVVQEIFGVHEHIKDVCRRLAKSGLLRDRAGALCAAGRRVEVHRHSEAHLRSRLQGARRAGDGRSRRDASPGRRRAARPTRRALGITGFCWGGRIVLHVLRAQSERQGGGRLVRIAGARRSIRATRRRSTSPHRSRRPCWACTAARTRAFRARRSRRCSRTLKAAGNARSEFTIYPDTPHGFNADYRPSYRKEQADDAWNKMIAWFKLNL